MSQRMNPNYLRADKLFYEISIRGETPTFSEDKREMFRGLLAQKSADTISTIFFGTNQRGDKQGEGVLSSMMISCCNILSISQFKSFCIAGDNGYWLCLIGLEEIKQQIKDNEVEKLLEAEKVEEESRMLNRALIAMRKEEEQKIIENKKRQKNLRDELRQANLDLERYKLVQKEEQRIADARIQEFMRQKAAREEAREAELEMIRAAKEKEIARLRAQQQRAQDEQAIMDEMQAIRIQEEVEKAWREKEKQAAIKKVEDMKELHEARLKQITDIRTAQAIAIARDEASFHKVAKVQQELFKKDQEKRAQTKEMNFKLRKEILKQINEKERQRINQLKEKYEDGKAFRLGQDMHDNQISDYIRSKVQSLRQEALPENYVIDIERQLKLLGND
ncbi:hypothetical protein HHI36_001805 [Cryptolaemus montrouzieri]|uniref:Cilia- and flagella-associated protein 45 n=1 Tax=Cryptolaemus montrouzieri TaxID=559131 RepID=A0ABD2PA06_9CUCU